MLLEIRHLAHKLGLSNQRREANYPVSEIKSSCFVCFLEEFKAGAIAPNAGEIGQ
jgi:hypothetical protein